MSDDDAIMVRFVRDYLELLDHRVESIRTHLDSGNYMTAHVALLSLESTSVMVGAQTLATVAGRLRIAVEQGERAVMPELMSAIVREAEQARRSLRAR